MTFLEGEVDEGHNEAGGKVQPSRPHGTQNCVAVQQKCTAEVYAGPSQTSRSSSHFSSHLIE
jgi:hypothetical protein